MAESEHGPNGQSASPRIHCEECHKEIPPSEVDQPEAEEYALYFCGLQCFEKWKENAEIEILPDDPSNPD